MPLDEAWSLNNAPPSLTLIFSIQLYFEITGDSYAAGEHSNPIYPVAPLICITTRYAVTQSRYS